ncbi:MAG: phosphodiester glycosidase family protein [Chthoniobacteraceae bacterium]
MLWNLQTLLWKFLPADRAVSFTLRVFGLLLVLSLATFIAAHFAKRCRLSLAAIVIAALTLFTWALLFITRPPWLQIAMQPVVPIPTITSLHWETRAPGLDTADLELRVGNTIVDHMVLARLDPRNYHFSVHWDPTATRTAEEWQRELGAAVVVNGSYFGQDHVPLTPLRCSDQPAGPANYQSAHGAFVTDGTRVDIIDLQNRDALKAIAPYPDAMISYPLLIDAAGANRAAESKVWLASRNFVALDEAGRIILGTTETGFFTLHRLGDFLKASPLGLRIALNLDGGPLVSQVIHASNFTRNFHGKAEISDGSDVLRVFWQAHVSTPWGLPVVLAAQPIPANPTPHLTLE